MMCFLEGEIRLSYMFSSHDLTHTSFESKRTLCQHHSIPIIPYITQPTNPLTTLPAPLAPPRLPKSHPRRTKRHSLHKRQTTLPNDPKPSPNPPTTTEPGLHRPLPLHHPRRPRPLHPHHLGRKTPHPHPSVRPRLPHARRARHL